MCFFSRRQPVDKEPARVLVSTQRPLSPYTFVLGFFLCTFDRGRREEASHNLTTCHKGHSLCLSRLQVQSYGSFPPKKPMVAILLYVPPISRQSTVIRQWRSNHAHRSCSTLVALHANIWAAIVHLSRHINIVVVVVVLCLLCGSYSCYLYFTVFIELRWKALCNLCMNCAIKLNVLTYLYWDTTWNLKYLRKITVHLLQCPWKWQWTMMEFATESLAPL